MLTVSFTSRIPQLAAAAANLAMQLYLDHERDQSFAALTDAQNWLEIHSASVQAQLDATEAQLAQARAAAGLVQGAQASLTTETVSRLAAALVQAQADMAMNQARLQSAAAGGDAAAANAAIAPNLLPLRQKPGRSGGPGTSRSPAQYGPNYPALAGCAQPARRYHRRDQRRGRARTGCRESRSRRRCRADRDTANSAEQCPHPGAERRTRNPRPIRALEQRAEAGQDMLRAMTQQAGQLAQDASLTKPDARILSTAAVPSQPSAPHHAPALAGGPRASGFVPAAAGGLARTRSIPRCIPAPKSAASTGLPCFALVPENPRPYLAALESPFSLYAEQLRALRTGLGLVGGPCKIIAITAARPGEGKTTLSIALARSLAAAGVRVLAIDGDIRQPGFDPLFCAGGAKGLTDYLAGVATRDEVVIEDLHHWRQNNAGRHAGERRLYRCSSHPLCRNFCSCCATISTSSSSTPPRFRSGRGPRAGPPGR